MIAAAAHQETNARFGTALALGTLTMFFVSLLFAYAYLRAGQSWPPAGLPFYPSLLPTVNLGVVAASSVFVHRASRGDRLSWAVALGLGVLFLVLQGALWSALVHAGFVPAATGAYGAVFFAITFAHAAHLLVGLFGLALAHRLESAFARWALYWHFVGAVWAAIVITVFWL